MQPLLHQVMVKFICRIHYLLGLLPQLESERLSAPYRLESLLTGTFFPAISQNIKSIYLVLFAKLLQRLNFKVLTKYSQCIYD